jgi:hypothetical protein
MELKGREEDYCALKFSDFMVIMEQIKTLTDEVNKEDFINSSLDFIQKSVKDANHFAYTKTALKKILEKQYDFIFSNGFPTNILNINTGIMTANAGDSAQFLFLARVDDPNFFLEPNPKKK